MKTKLLKSVSAICVTLLCVSPLFSQKWYDMTQDDQATIEEIKKEAEAYFDEVGRGSHTGYKGYQRWLYNASLTLDESGHQYKVQEVQDKMARFRKSETKQRRAADNIPWKTVGPFTFSRTSSWAPGQGRVTAIAVEKVNQQLIVVGSPGGGVWKSLNAGQSWIPLGDQLDNMSVWGVAIDPNNANHLLHLNGSNDLMESNNQGSTWTKIRDFGGSNSRPSMILFHPTNSSLYFVSSTSGLFKTTDGGASFTEVITSSTEDVVFKPGSTSVMYATGNDFWKSTNGGDSWTRITNGLIRSERMKVAVTAADPNVVYVIQKQGSGFGRIYRSTNSGTSFTVRSDINNGAPNYLGNQASRDMAIVCSSTDPNRVHIAGLNNYRSDNGGTSFTSLANWNRPTDPSYIHADVEVMTNVNGTLYAGSDGGIFRSPAGGNNYTDLTKGGLAISQFYRMGGSAPHPNSGAGQDVNRLVAGAQDNGTMVSTGADRNWLAWLGADGMECMIDYNNANIIYGTSQYGTLHRSTDGGQSFRYLPDVVDYNGSWVIPFQMDPVVSTTIYAGYQEVFRSTNSGQNWTAVTNGITGGRNTDHIAMSPANNNFMYMAEGTRVWVSKNVRAANPTWTALSGIAGTVNYMAVDPKDANHVVVATTGTRLYESKNAGSTWTDISANLPAIGITCIVIDNKATNGMYVGLTQGVYYKDDTQNSWETYGSGMPNVSIRELEINYQNNMLRCATYGRGIWEIGIFGSTISPVITRLTEGTKCPGEVVLLEVTPDPSWEAPISYQWSVDGKVIAGATNKQISVTEAGQYAVTVNDAQASGVGSIVVTYAQRPEVPNVIAQQLCGPGTVTLTASSSGDGTIKWFSDESGTNELGSGSTYTTQLQNTQTFYVKEESKVMQSAAGLVNNTTTNEGGIHPGGQYLIFDALTPFRLLSCKVYAEGAGDRTLELKNANDEIILTKIINIPNGESVVTLNLDIPIGKDMKIGFPAGANLYRGIGNSFSYPFVLENVLSINSTTANAPATNYYYYLYDWKVLPNVPKCYSSSATARAVVLTPLDAPVLDDVTTCGPETIVLSAISNDNGTIKWYNANEDSIGTGNQLVVDINAATNFSAEIVPELEIKNGGASLASAQGGNHNGNFGLVFDAVQAFNLKSVKINAEGAGTRTIDVYNQANELIQTLEVNVANGEQRIPLNLEFPKGQNYKLVVRSVANLFRSNEGVSYPVSIAGYANITAGFRVSDFSTLDNFYYYFYDWEIGVASESCVSPRASMNVFVENCTGLSTFNGTGLNLYPNPSSGMVHLEIPAGFNLTAIEVTDLNGNTLLASGEYEAQLDLTGFKSGAYFVQVRGELGIQVFKLIVE